MKIAQHLLEKFIKKPLNCYLVNISTSNCSSANRWTNGTNGPGNLLRSAPLAVHIFIFIKIHKNCNFLLISVHCVYPYSIQVDLCKLQTYIRVFCVENWLFYIISSY